MKGIFGLIIIFIGLFQANAGQVPNEMSLVEQYASAKLVQLRLVLNHAVRHMEENPSQNILSGHFAMKSIAKSVPGLRSILAIGSDGQLLFDSYNPVLFSIDLSQREYFRRTMKSDIAEMIISVPVVGKQSGQLFLPVSMKMKRGRGIVMASVFPEFLLPRIDLCNGCGMGAIQDDKILVSNPITVVLPGSVTAAVARGGEYGKKIINVNNIAIELHWKKAENTPITYIYYKSFAFDR